MAGAIFSSEANADPSLRVGFAFDEQSIRNELRFLSPVALQLPPTPCITCG
jgi:hypothetical protein